MAFIQGVFQNIYMVYTSEWKELRFSLMWMLTSENNERILAHIPNGAG